MKRSILVFLLMAVVVGTLIAQAPAPPPPATGPIADAVNAIVVALNKQDAATLNKFVTADALWLDEDGHMIPAARWIPRLTAPGKKLTIANLRVAQPTPDSGWAAFNYVLEEAAGKIEGMDSIMFKKTGDAWQATLIHAAVNGKAIAPH